MLRRPPRVLRGLSRALRGEQPSRRDAFSGFICTILAQNIPPTVLLPLEQEELVENLRNCAEKCEYKDECVVITGHSQGAAIASIAALYLSDLVSTTILQGMRLFQGFFTHIIAFATNYYRLLAGPVCDNVWSACGDRCAMQSRQLREVVSLD